MGESGREKAERCYKHGHHDGAKAEDGTLHGCLANGIAAGANLVDAFEHDDACLHGDTEESEEADAGRYAEVIAGEVESNQAADWGDGDIGKNEHGPLEGVENAVKDHKDEKDGDGEHHHEATGAALLAGVLAGPVEVITGGKLYLLGDLVHRFAAGAAEVATAHAVLDGYKTAATFAVDLFGTIFDLDVGELGE